VSATRGIADLAARDNGSIIVFTAMLLPVVLLFLTLTVDIGNWWVHKRHLQLQVDAAALAGGALFGKCFIDPAAGNTAIQDEATRFGGAGGSSYNSQVGGAGSGTVNLVYQSATYPNGTVDPDPPETDPPCDTPSLMFDVKGSNEAVPLIFQIPGLSSIAAINARARVELKTVEIQSGMLPVAVPDLRFTYAFATFVNEATGATLGTVQLVRGSSSGPNTLWNAPPAGIPVSIPSAHVGVRLRLVGGSDPNAACGQLFTECYDLGSANGVAHIRGWSTATAPAVRNAWLLAGSCLPDAYFAAGNCSGGVQAEVDLGALHPLTGAGVTTRVWATVDGIDTQLTPGGTSGLVTWTANSGLSFAGSGPHTVALNWDWKKTSGTWVDGGGHLQTCTTASNNKCKDNGTLGPVQRAFVAGSRSGPVQRVQVFESGVTTSGSNSFQIGTTHTLGVSIAVSGSIKVQSDAGDPVVQLRVTGTGSANQSIDCDPALSNLADELEHGCAPEYKLNPSLACPAQNVLWTLPQPWLCVKVQTGGAVGQVDHGLQQRILGGSSSCTAPINWPDYELDDPRIVSLIITPFGSFGGSGTYTVPVIDFGAFYVTGWNGDPCPGADVVASGDMAGHFIKYAAPNPNGAGDLACNPDALTPCVAVLTR